MVVGMVVKLVVRMGCLVEREEEEGGVVVVLWLLLLLEWRRRWRRKRWRSWWVERVKNGGEWPAKGGLRAVFAAAIRWLLEERRRRKNNNERERKEEVFIYKGVV